MAIGLPPNRRNISGSGFTNLQRILQASKTNRLGQTVGSGIQQAGDTARRAIQKAGTEFETKVGTEKARQAGESARADRVLGDVSQASDEDIKAFETIRGGKSQGPTSIANADDLRYQAQEAEKLGKSTGTEVGRLGLLQRYVGGGKRYTGGQQSVDSLLLGQTGSQNLKQSRRNVSGLQEKAAGQEFAAKEMGKELASSAKGLADTTIGRLGGIATEFDTAMEAKRIAEQEALKAKQENVRKQLEAGEVEEALFDRLGIKEGDKLWRTNLTDFYKPQENIATKENVMNQADFNKIQALRKLSGQSLTGDPSKVLSQYTDASQIGAFGAMSPYEFEKEALAQKINNERQSYEAVASPQEQDKAKYTGYLFDQQIAGGPAGMVGTLDKTTKSWVDYIKQTQPNSQLSMLANQYNPNATPEEKAAFSEALYRGLAASPSVGIDPQTGSLRTPLGQSELSGLSNLIGLYKNYSGTVNTAQANIDAMRNQYQFNRTLKRRGTT